MDTLNVVFRKERSGEVLAVFPSIPAADARKALDACYKAKQAGDA